MGGRGRGFKRKDAVCKKVRVSSCFITRSIRTQGNSYIKGALYLNWCGLIATVCGDEWLKLLNVNSKITELKISWNLRDWVTIWLVYLYSKHSERVEREIKILSERRIFIALLTCFLHSVPSFLHLLKGPPVTTLGSMTNVCSSLVEIIIIFCSELHWLIFFPEVIGGRRNKTHFGRGILWGITTESETLMFFYG